MALGQKFPSRITMKLTLIQCMNASLLIKVPRVPQVPEYLSAFVVRMFIIYSIK